MPTEQAKQASVIWSQSVFLAPIFRAAFSSLEDFLKARLINEASQDTVEHYCWPAKTQLSAWLTLPKEQAFMRRAAIDVSGKALHCLVRMFEGQGMLREFLTSKHYSYTRGYGLSHGLLIVAIENGNIEGVRILIKAYEGVKWDVSDTTDFLSLGLETAVKKGHLEMVQILCAQYEGNAHLERFLVRAVESGQLRMLEFLYAQSDRCWEALRAHEYCALFCAAGNANNEVVKFLCAHYDNWKELRSALSAQNHLALRTAVEGGHVEVVRFLSTQYDVDTFQEVLRARDYSLLRCAAMKGHLEVVKFLCAQCDNSELKKALRACEEEMYGGHCHAALKWSANHGHLEVVKFLCSQYDRDELQKLLSANCYFFLKSIAHHGHIEVVKFLLTVCEDKYAAVSELRAVDDKHHPAFTMIVEALLEGDNHNLTGQTTLKISSPYS